MEGIGKGLTGILIMVSLVSMFFGAVAVWSMLRDNPLKSTVPIEPRIELTINNNQIDTLYVYEIK